MRCIDVLDVVESNASFDLKKHIVYDARHFGCDFYDVNTFYQEYKFAVNHQALQYRHYLQCWPYGNVITADSVDNM